jgi:hypothetical protein
MTGPSRRGGPLGRRLLMRAGPLAAVAALAAALLAGGGGSAGATPAAPPRYSALEGTQATGLAVIEPQSAPAPSGAPQPSIEAQAPAGAEDWPVTSSIRRLALGGGLSAWIARSSQGGICVLLYDGVPVKGVAAVYVGCSGAEALEQGASVEVGEIPGMPGEVIAAGVVPDGVSSVSEAMADGSTVTSQVSGNAWARVSAVSAAAGAEPTENTGG